RVSRVMQLQWPLGSVRRRGPRTGLIGNRASPSGGGADVTAGRPVVDSRGHVPARPEDKTVPPGPRASAGDEVRGRKRVGFRTVVTGSRIRRRVGLVAIVIVGLVSGTIIQAFSWNQTAHYALI